MFLLPKAFEEYNIFPKNPIFVSNKWIHESFLKGTCSACVVVL